MNKEELFRKARLPENRKVAFDRLLDKYRLADKRGTCEYTSFYDPETLQGLEGVLHHLKDVPWESQGGTPEAEYQVVVFNRQQCEESPLKVATIRSNKKECQWNHRNVLGAVLGTGIQRDRIGDIHLHSWGAQVVCLKEAADSLEWTLTSIGHDEASITIESVEALEISETQWQEQVVVVSSLRVDAVAAAVWNLSRGDAQDLVRRERIKINYKTASSPSQAVEPGDLISIRGFGRFDILENLGTTRKDRMRIRIQKTKR